MTRETIFFKVGVAKLRLRPDFLPQISGCFPVKLFTKVVEMGGRREAILIS